jgi:hypothetical protein
VLIPVGDVALDIDVPQIDEKMGGAFVPRAAQRRHQLLRRIAEREAGSGG